MTDRLSAIDALTPDELAQFMAGTLVLVYDCPKQFTAAEVSAAMQVYRSDPLFFDVPSVNSVHPSSPISANPETSAEGK